MHLALILDGNGRWAIRQGMPREFGHLEGAKVVPKIIEKSRELGIKYLTLYVLSTDNMKRPETELNSLYEIIQCVIYEIESMIERLQFNFVCIGDVTKTPLIFAARKHKKSPIMTVCVAINYSGKWDLEMGFKRQLEVGDTDPKSIYQYLPSGFLPDVDMLIRTGGEKRLSNFLLPQIVYAELYFIDKCWPDFTPTLLEELVVDYRTNRVRTFGSINMLPK